MKRALSRAFDPPAPMVPVGLRAPSVAMGPRAAPYPGAQRAPGGLDLVSLEGKLDTGADLCAVPDQLVANLDLPPVRTVRAAGFLGGLQEVIVYRVDVLLDGMEFLHVEALATRRPYAILGRNVLRRLVMRVDGPRERLEIGLPRARRA